LLNNAQHNEEHSMNMNKNLRIDHQHSHTEKHSKQINNFMDNNSNELKLDFSAVLGR
jgi:hypothetical protein